MVARRSAFSGVLFLLVALYIGGYVLYRSAGGATKVYPRDGGPPSLIVAQDRPLGAPLQTLFRPCLILEEYYHRMNRNPV
ncbi:MAG TPA: hypothetical protein VGB55_10320 [Tepidisphaeraceae bacterium]|jgi:hypothetical protein